MGKQSNTDAQKTYQFDGWQVIPDANELIRKGEFYTIEPRVMRALCVLIEQQQRVVEREYLISAVWPDNVIVSDQSVTQLLGSLRKVLNDSARSPKYIQTIPKRGYRFIASCETHFTAVNTPIPSNHSAALSDSAVNMLQRPPTSGSTVTRTPTQGVHSTSLTTGRDNNNSHSEQIAAGTTDNSPNSSEINDKFDTTTLAETTVNQSVAPPATHHAQLSLSSARPEQKKPLYSLQFAAIIIVVSGILFALNFSDLLFDDKQNRKITVSSDSTSSAQPSPKAAQQSNNKPTKPHSLSANVVALTNSPGVERFPTVSPNGKWLAFSWEDYQTETNIFIKSLDDASAKRIQLTFDNARELKAVWSPDSTQIAFARFTGERECAIITMNIETRKQQYVAQCVNSQFSAESIEWSSDNLLYFKHKTDREPKEHTNEHQRTGISRVTPQTGQIEPIPCHLACQFDDMDISVSPNNSQFVLTRQISLAGQDLFLYSANLSQPEQRVTHDGVQILGHTFSNDGQFLYYVTLKSGEPALWQYHLANQTHTNVDLGTVTPTYPTRIPDSKSLLFTRQERQFYINQVKLNPDDAQQSPIVQSYASNFDPAMNQHTRELAYTSGVSGKSEVWIVDLDTMQYEQVTESGIGSLSPAWSSDGQQLVYINYENREQPRLAIYDKNTKTHRFIATSLEAMWGPQFSEDSTEIFISAVKNGTRRIWSIDIASETIKQETAEHGFVVHFDPSHPQQLLFTQQQKGGLWMLNRATKQEKLVLPELQDMHLASWIATETHIVYLFSATDHDYVKRMNRKTQQIETLVTLPKKSAARYTTGGISLRRINDQNHLLFVHNGVLQADIFRANLSND